MSSSTIRCTILICLYKSYHYVRVWYRQKSSQAGPGQSSKEKNEEDREKEDESIKETHEEDDDDRAQEQDTNGV